MAERIVHRLEAVEVHQQQRARLRLAAVALQRAFEQVGDVAPVRKAGQRVIARELVDLALGPLLVGQVGAAAAEPLEIAELVADRLARDRPPALLARHRRLHRQFLERRARRQAEAQRPLLALVLADALADDVGKGVAEQMGERPVEARRDGGRDIDKPSFAIGFPEPAAPRTLEIAHQVERALLVADREARRARRAPLMADILTHHRGEQAQEDETGDAERPRRDPDRTAEHRRPGKGEEGGPHDRRRRRGDQQRPDMDRGEGVEIAASVGNRDRGEHRRRVEQGTERDQRHAQYRHRPHALVRDRPGTAHRLADHHQRHVARQPGRHHQPVRGMIEKAGGARQKSKAQESKDAADEHIMPQLRDAHDVGNERGRIERRFTCRQIARSRLDDGAPYPQCPDFPALCDGGFTGRRGLPNPYRSAPVSADTVPKRRRSYRCNSPEDVGFGVVGGRQNPPCREAMGRGTAAASGGGGAAT